MSPGKKPSVLVFLRLPAGFKASAVLNEGDKAQKISLRLLEKTADSMEGKLHDNLHKEHDRLRTARIHIGELSFMARIERWDEIVGYKNRAVALKNRTVASSELTRSSRLWKFKHEYRDSSSQPMSSNPVDRGLRRRLLARNDSSSSDLSGANSGPSVSLVEEPLEEATSLYSEGDDDSQISAISLASRNDLDDFLGGRSVSGDYVGTANYSNPFNGMDDHEGMDTGRA